MRLSEDPDQGSVHVVVHLPDRFLGRRLLRWRGLLRCHGRGEGVVLGRGPAELRSLLEEETAYVVPVGGLAVSLEED